MSEIVKYVEILKGNPHFCHSQERVYWSTMCKQTMMQKLLCVFDIPCQSQTRWCKELHLWSKLQVKNTEMITLLTLIVLFNFFVFRSTFSLIINYSMIFLFNY